MQKRKRKLKRKLAIIALLAIFLMLLCSGWVLAENAVNPSGPAATDSDTQITGDPTPGMNELNSLNQANTDHWGKAMDTSQPLQIPSEAEEGSSFATKSFTHMLMDFVNAVIHVFGLHTVDEMVRSTTHLFWGALDANDVNTVSKGIIPFTAIAWTIAALSIQVFAVRMAHSTVNSRRRAKLYDFMENWLFGACLLTFGLKLMNLIFQISSVFVNMFMDTFNGSFNPMATTKLNGGAGDAIGLAVYLLIIAGITLALNFMYIQRYVVLLVYSLLSPFFFLMYFFDSTREQFWDWVKEIISLAAMPAIHGMMMWLFLLVTGGSDAKLVSIVFLLMFIPLADMVRKRLGVAGGTGGLQEGMLQGVGLGIALSGMRSVGGLFAAMSGNGGMVDHALMGMRNLGGPPDGGGGFLNHQGQSSVLSGGNPVLNRTQAFVAKAQSFGSRTGGIIGGVGGAIFGAATGNHGMIGLTGFVGQSAGSHAGAWGTGKVAGRAAVAGQILTHGTGSAASAAIDNSPEGASPAGMIGRGILGGLGQAVGNVRNWDGVKENVFGAGGDLSPELKDLRGDIAAANVAGIQGQFHKQNRINNNIARAMQQVMPSMSGVAPREGDTAFSRSFPNRTEYYYQPKGSSPRLVDISAAGDQYASFERPIEQKMEYRLKKDNQGNLLGEDWVNMTRQAVQISPQLGRPGLPMSWNTRQSILKEA